jgi:hypothetical protein
VRLNRRRDLNRRDIREVLVEKGVDALGGGRAARREIDRRVGERSQAGESIIGVEVLDETSAGDGLEQDRRGLRRSAGNSEAVRERNVPDNVGPLVRLAREKDGKYKEKEPNP